MATILLSSLKATCLADTWWEPGLCACLCQVIFKAPLSGHKFEMKSVSRESWLKVLSGLSREGTSVSTPRLTPAWSTAVQEAACQEDCPEDNEGPWARGLVPTACSMPELVFLPSCPCSGPAESESDVDPTRVLFRLSGHTKAHFG